MRNARARACARARAPRSYRLNACPRGQTRCAACNVAIVAPRRMKLYPTITWKRPGAGFAQSGCEWPPSIPPVAAYRTGSTNADDGAKTRNRTRGANARAHDRARTSERRRKRVARSRRRTKPEIDQKVAFRSRATRCRSFRSSTRDFLDLGLCVKATLAKSSFRTCQIRKGSTERHDALARTPFRLACCLRWQPRRAGGGASC